MDWSRLHAQIYSVKFSEKKRKRSIEKFRSKEEDSEEMCMSSKHTKVYIHL